MKRDYAPVRPDAAMEDDCRQLVRLAIREDLEGSLDWTTVALVPAERRGVCDIVPRQQGVCAGLVTLPWIIEEADAELQFEPLEQDGQPLTAGQPIARLAGNARDLLTCERLILNVLCRLCGIATLTQQYATKVADSSARLYDTRKTTPGWRRLEKYAVGCGGGHNHRAGLFDGFLIKDNHLALGGEAGPLPPYEAACTARQWSQGRAEMSEAPRMVEIEVDSLDQLRQVLPARPDIVLLDNFSLDELRQAVELRDQLAPQVELEASGNVTLDTIEAISKTGVDRISSGALTHQAGWLDLGLDWRADPAS